MNYRSVSFINDVSLLKNKPWSFDFILLSTATEGPEKSVWDQATADRGEASWLPIPARYIWNNLQRVCLYSHNHAFFFVLKKNGQFWVNFNDIWLKYMCSCCEWSCVYRYYHIHCIYRLFEICHYYYCVYKWETNVDMYYLISDN